MPISRKSEFQNIQAMSPAGFGGIDEQALMLLGDGPFQGRGRAPPRDVLAPGIRAAEEIAGGGHPVSGVRAVGLDVREHIIVDHPLGVAGGRLQKLRVKRQRLLGRGGNGVGREALVQVDAEERRLGGRIGPGAVDQLEHVLFVGQRVAAVVSQVRRGVRGGGERGDGKGGQKGKGAPARPAWRAKDRARLHGRLRSRQCRTWSSPIQRPGGHYASVLLLAATQGS